MQMQMENGAGKNIITGYADDEIGVNGKPFYSSVIVSPTHIVHENMPASFADVANTHIAIILDFQPEIVIIGAGLSYIAPPPWLSLLLFEHGVGLEIMKTPSACGTYNVLVTDDRNIAALLII